MRKLFLFLIAALMSVGMCATTVTWDSNTLSSIFYIKDGQSFTKDGVTLTALSGEIDGEEGSWKGASPIAAFKFSTSLGNFTRIEITGDIYGLAGSGWTQDSPGAVWTGDANETTFGNYFVNVTQIVFTIDEPAPASATSGSCGDNLTWEFDPATGALTISGTGAMDNYSWDPNAAPWYEYKDAITSVSFPKGITTIGAYAFVNCDNAAFTTVTIPEGVIALGVNAFYNCDGIQEITIPSTVTTIEVGAIYDCKAVNSITSYIASPTNLHGYAIYGYKNTCTLYVPYASIAAYQAADCWKYIPNIAAIPGTEPQPAGQNYNLTLADVSDAHGSVAFSVDGNDASQAKKDDVVSVSVTPNEGYSAKDVAVRAYTSWEDASDILAGGGDNPGLVSDVNVAKQENGTWSFNMPAANVWVVVSYSKNLQDAWIIDIPAYEYSGEAIEPAVDVMDGETALVLNSDYTVAYSNNVNAGIATVTVTAVEGSNYSGSASKTFEILKAENSWTTVPAAVEGLIYSGEAQTLISAGVAVYGTVLYSLDGENYSEALPQAANAGSYTVFYKAEGDANHNGIDAQTLNVTIATDKSALNNAISEAEQYHNSISESNPGIAEKLLDAINAAKGVKDNADATQSEVEDATQTLTDALNAAKAEVALKRVTIVIPAKSYMARIDADKRRIEDAVEGVQLFSVKNVTNTEVILTDELSVIAEEMPYFIYNDNDTEMEVSLIVSNDDADNVAYDSEHFKGTLVDKTFTEEDMAEKDYYVLSDSDSFVWVKDAGTLSAGKCWIELGKSPTHAPRLIIVSKNTATGISNSEAGSATTKVLRNGQVLILRRDKTYTVQGAEVK